jgi:hypothetical protein
MGLYLAVEFDKAPIKAKEFARLRILRVVHEVKLREARVILKSLVLKLA